MAQKPYIQPIPAFTGLRGLASLAVVAYHFRDALQGHVPDTVVAALGQGFLAVDLFFILSGFVIYLNYRWMFDDFSLRSTRLFVAARLGRVYPVHLFVSLAYLLNPVTIMLFSTARDLGTRYDPGYYLMSLFLVHNWGLTNAVEWNVPSWSISTEWFAYLMFPLLLIGLKSRTSRPRAIVARMVGIFLVLAVFFALAGVQSIGENIPQFGVLRCLLEFLAGIALCQLYLTVKPPRQLLNAGLLIAALGLTVITIGLDLPDFLFIPAAFALLLFSLTTNEAPLSKLLSIGPLQWLGEISYSLYMIHFLIKDWVKFASGSYAPTPALFALYIALALAAAFAVHILIEKPGMQLFKSRSLKKA